MFYLKKLFALGKLEYKTSLVYRMRFMSSIVISPLMLMMVFFLWQAVYSNNAGEVILGYSFTEMMTYYVISMIIGHFIFT
ncbi:hypothetical protein JXC34_03145, partial [Candidatus Woesearchaeota archaeon]|nr:hypothetical protein [Candidatus Woesearchaeota archaeon]